MTPTKIHMYRDFVTDLSQLFGMRRHAAALCDAIEAGKDVAFEAFCLFRDGEPGSLP